MSQVDQIKQLLKLCTDNQKAEIFRYLRSEFPIHPLEKKLNIEAEAILEAIDRADELILRNIRGVIAEAAFDKYVLSQLIDIELPPISTKESDKYDYLVRDNVGEIRVQVKLQRSEKGQPKVIGRGMYAVEIQRTRTGIRRKKAEDNESNEVVQEKTRPYHFSQFDIIAVCMFPSTGNWSDFMYTVGDWLLPRPKHPNLIKVMQPVAQTPNEDWTNNFITCISWLRSNKMKTIQSHYSATHHL